ncbi:MAG: right-handed parallel beta-helix repeat-containing protein, partial [Myxococcaceae bacterium]|nr:right-handed parallel beta-helix repeat-containing protein [Myxococcaceae bacterium]
ASPAAGFELFSDLGCTTPTTTATLGVNTSTTIVYFRGMLAGAVTVTAASPGLQSGVQTENLTAGAGLALTFTSAAQTVVAGACSGALDVGLLDALGNPSVAQAAMAIGFGATPAGVTFFSDAACTTAASAVSLAAGAASGTIYFRGTVATAVMIEATSPGFTPAQQVETVTPAAPAAVVFTSPPQTVGIGACSSAATLEVRDAFGNVSPVAALTGVTLSAQPAAGFGFFSDPSCATAAGTLNVGVGGTTASFFFRGSALGQVTVTASPAGLAAATQVETLVPGAAARLTFTTPARSAQAATCSGAVTVTVQDASGNASPVASALSVALSVGGLQLFTDAACTAAGAGLTIAAGQSSGTYYFRSNAAATYPMTASAGGLLEGAQTATVTPAPADRLAFVTPARTASAGACSAVVTVARRDAFGNDSPGAAATVGLTAMPSAGFTFYTDAACTTAATSVALGAGAAQASFYFIGTMAAAETLTATSAGLMPATQGATVTAAAAPTQLVFTTPARTVTAGACSQGLTVQSRDSFNNPRTVAASTAVALAGAGATFYSDAACTMAVTQVNIAAAADSATFYLRGTTAGALSVTATAAALNPATQTQTVNAAAPDRLVFTTAPQTLPVGGCSAAATVQPRDAFGNTSAPAAAQTVGLSSGAGVTFYSNAGCTTAATSVTLGAGSTSASLWFRGTQTGMRTLTAQVAGWAAGAQGATFNAGAPSQLVVTTPARTVAAGACSQELTVEARDAFGNPANVGVATNVTLSALPSAGFTFHSNAACSAAAGTLQISAGSSSVSFYVRGTSAATVGVTAAAGGLTAANQSVTVTAGAASVIAFTTPARSAVAGACSQVLTVELRDGFGNPAPVGAATALNLTAMPAAGFAFHGNAGCSMAGGTATVPAGQSTASFYFRGTSVGSITVTVSGAGLTSANQGQTVTAGPAASFQWDPVASPRAFNTPFGVTVRARDAFGNVATGFAGTAALSVSPAGAVSCTSSCTNTTTTDVFAAGVWSGTVTLTNIAVVGANRTLTATQGATNGTSNTFTVTGPATRSPPIARFTWSPAVINTGQTVNFDASSSSDYQTPTAQLQVSFDPENDGNFSGYTTTKTFSHRYDVAGLYRVRMLVRDTDGDIDYRSGWVRVLNAGDRRCRVTTSSDVDDGATNCTGSNGADGQLSLAEAVRLSNSQVGTDRITFANAMTVTSTGSYALTGDTQIYAQAGVILAGKTFAVSGANADVEVYGLEMTAQSSPVAVSGTGATLVLTDVYFHDMAGVTMSSGDVTLEQVRMSNCTQACVAQTAAGAGLLSVRYSDFRNSPSQAALSFSGGCSGSLLDMFSNTFTDFAFGVQATCSGTMAIRHNTFEAVGTGIALNGGANNVVQNNIFSNVTVSAGTCGAATFTTRSHHVLFGNVSNGCLNGDPSTLTSNPSYAFASADDLRVAFGSPAVNSAFDTGLDLCLGFPGDYLGSGPDRGGRESY